MTTFISILRGINVGGKNQLKMDALRQLFIDLGFSNVQSYIQSGNVLFQSDESDPQIVKEIIKKEIFDIFNINVPVIVLSVEELRTIIQMNPFIFDKTKETNYLHITFLGEEIDASSFERLKKSAFGNDEFELIYKAIYLYCPDGYGKTKLTNTFFEKKLNIEATTRNWKTSTELARLSDKY